MKDDKYTFLPLTILVLPCSSNVLVSGHIQLSDYLISFCHGMKSGFTDCDLSTKHIADDSPESEYEKGCH